MKTKKVLLYISKKNDVDLLAQVLLNSNQQFSEKKFPFQLKKIEIGENLYKLLCQIIIGKFDLIKKLGNLDFRHSERDPKNYTSLINHLVFYKWKQEEEKETISLLKMWSDLGYFLTRNHYFTNGNKRTALLTMKTFISICGFYLVDSSQGNLASELEELFLNIAKEDIEKDVALKLIKEKIMFNICA